MQSEQQSNDFIQNSFGDRYLFKVNGTAFDKIGSAAVYLKQFDEKIFEENHFYVFLGTDSGLLPKYLLQKGLPVGTTYMFIELPELIDEVRTELDLTEDSEKLMLTTFDCWQKEAVAIEFQNYVYLDNMQFHRSIAAEDLNIDAYQEIGRELQEELEQIRWMLHAEMGSELFTRRQLENLAENRLSAACLRGSFSGRTAVVLGGGPSLDDSISWVIENRDSMLVIAVSRICRRLLEVGLIPDIVVSIDPNQISYDISKEMLLLHERTIFVNQYHVSSRLLGQWRGRNFYMGQRLEWVEEDPDQAFNARGPTVTNCAIDLAVQIGVERILLVGVDLCFSRKGFTHAQGSNEYGVGPQLGTGQLWVETNSGEMAETTADFHFAISTIAGQATMAADCGCQLINMGDWAARIDGVAHASWRDIVLSPLPQPAFEMLADWLPPENSELRTAHQRAMLDELETAASAFREIRKLACEGVRANDGFFGRVAGGKGEQKYKAKLDRIEKKLKKGFDVFNPMLKKAGIRDFLKLTQGEGADSWTSEDIDRLGRIYFEAYRDTADRLLQMVEDAQKRLEARLAEESGSPDLTQIFSQWQRDQQPGRFYLWRQRNPGITISEELTAQVAAFEAAFKEDLDDRQTMHMARARAWSELGPVCGKLKLLYRRGERENLAHLVDCLDPQRSTDEKALLHLGQGFIAELDEKTDDALEEYRNLIDELAEEKKGSVLEEGLLRVFSISLERTDSESALLAAECLASIAPTYLPYYADMLKLTGDKGKALDTYADYLEAVREDLPVMLKMGCLYMEAGVTEGAKLMFDMVLEREPWNQAALHFLETLEQNLTTEADLQGQIEN